MLADELVAQVRQDCNMPSAAGRAQDTEILRRLNEAKDLMADALIKCDLGYFETSENVSFVANQETYDIPAHFKDDVISRVERLNTDGTVRWGLEYIPWQRKDHFEVVGGAGATSDAGRVYYLFDRKIGFKPKPTAAETSAIKLYGKQHPADMFWGVIPASGLTTTAFVMPDSGADLKAGRVHTETDYYKNAIVRIITGANGRGIERTITGFNATTKTATIGTAWTTGDVTGQQFVIICKIPDKWHHAMKAYAVMGLSVKTPERQRYEMARRTWETYYGRAGEMVGEHAQPRHSDESLLVQPPVDYDW